MLKRWNFDNKTWLHEAMSKVKLTLEVYLNIKFQYELLLCSDELTSNCEMPSEFNFLPKNLDNNIKRFFFILTKKNMNSYFIGVRHVPFIYEIFGCWFRLVAFLIHFLLWHLGQNNACICIHLRLFLQTIKIVIFDIFSKNRFLM